MTSKLKLQAVTNKIRDEFYELNSKMMMLKVNVEQLENNMKLLENNLKKFKLEMMSFMEQQKTFESKAVKFQQGKHSTHSVPVSQDRTSGSASKTESLTMVSIPHNNPSSNGSTTEASTTTAQTSSMSLIPNWLSNNQEFAELESCYDDIVRSMPDDYMQTVQSLEHFLCDLHISVICEYSSVSVANKTILECLTEKVAYKEHVLDFCERLLLITNAPELKCTVENLRESVVKSLQETHLLDQQVYQLSEVGEEIKVFSEIEPDQFTPEVVNLLKKYYHNLLTNIIPEDARNVNISEVTWVTTDISSLCCMSNKQFLDVLILATPCNHYLLRFCNTLNLFMDLSDERNIMKTFKDDLIIAFKSNALTNLSSKNSLNSTDNKTTVGINSDCNVFEKCCGLSSKGIALLRKYYSNFLENLLPLDYVVTLEKLCTVDITVCNEILPHFMSCSSSQECNKLILHFLIESNKSDNQLLAFSFLMELLTNEFNVAVLFRNDCLEMLLDKVTCTNPQEEMSTLFPYTSAINDNLADNDSDHQLSNTASLGIINKISPESYEG